MTRKTLKHANTVEIDKRFSLHQLLGNQVERESKIRNEARQLAYLINIKCPESREKSLALTKLEEVVMWAKKSIERDEQ